jgi:thioredoxin 1
MFEELTDRDIYDRAISAEKPAVVVFYKPGSEKNQELFDLLAKFRAIYGDKVNFFAMNAEENTTPKTWASFTFRRCSTLGTPWNWKGTTTCPRRRK